MKYNMKRRLLNILIFLALSAFGPGMLGALSSCSRDGLSGSREYDAVVCIDNGRDGTKAMNDSDIESIAIFAFSGDVLVGYVYENGLLQSGKRTFPMNLSDGGAIDFYVIANPDRGFYHIVDGSGNELDLSGTDRTNPPAGITPAYLESCSVQMADGYSAAGDWLVPMTNIQLRSGENRRFNLDGGAGKWTYVNIDVTRAVSKVRMLFIRNDDFNDFQYVIDNISLTRKVVSCPLLEGTPEQGTSYSATDIGESLFVRGGNDSNGYIDKTFHIGNDNSVPSDLYINQNLYDSFGEYYIFPNIFGGNNAGIPPSNTSSPDFYNATVITVNYRDLERIDTGFWPWEDDEYIYGNKVNNIYLPAIDRNICVTVWCVLGGDGIDRTFTYTVSDWDETVEIDVPDFN